MHGHCSTATPVQAGVGNGMVAASGAGCYIGIAVSRAMNRTTRLQRIYNWPFSPTDTKTLIN